MTKTIQKLRDALNKLSQEVEKYILSGEFEILTAGTTYTIDVPKLRVEIWMANLPQNTRIYRIPSLGIGEQEWRQSFDAPHEVRQAILDKAKTDDSEEHC